MKTNTLVVYASKYGSTAEIAQQVGKMLGKSGIDVDILPVEDVRDIRQYKAVVLGSAIYVGKWLKEAEKFLIVNEGFLVNKKVWLFASGPTGLGDPFELINGQDVPASMRQVIARINPREVKVFHGNIDPEKVNAIEKWAVKSVVKKPFGDFRDWNSIINWAGSIATELLAA